MKILSKLPKRWGIYTPIRKLAVRLMWQPDRPGGRPAGRPPTVKNVTVGQTRSTARSTQTNRELCSQTRSTASVDRSCVCQTCTSLCTSVDRKGRPAHGAVDRSGRPTWPVSHRTGSEKLGKIFLKNLLSFLKIP